MLVAERESAEFYETVLARLADKARDGKLAANWVINELFGRLNKEGVAIAASPVSAEQLAAIVDLIGEERFPARSPRTCLRSSGRRAAIRARSSRRAA
ncbi:hypothetical protein BraRD5C2_13870 [Bradyrhizobium sp. RD5-C2]|nr:hypothetical protein BraRD5C2_13870 [Bradyrhizobium sp. RD5-C2]